ncbi:phosphopentomutase [candidate division WOR-3 bacterium RBG_13_43_14]|uniref:Phosphopentomutase n=1 Tax=candidate division WOR-3 bacterium RBG_13_43_14 TaxID=1802590 RepID=A0A1F4U9J8_UNCW3|nr:MAG: phosphopentomutase [candidate division WOR-3 bacterium RBG_13_43_14]
MMKRVIIIILDGVGIGELPDADLYNDQGSNTLVNLAHSCHGLRMPTMEKMGIGNIDSIKGVVAVADPIACYGKMTEISPGKDSTSGHWELFGIILKKPFPTYPDGFPASIINEFENCIGHKIIGNYPASGTEIIKELGDQHIKNRTPIVYTSADSVFQIAAHIDVFPLSELYRFCEIAREILQGEHAVARVIARPFNGESPLYYRTKDRRDFSLPPPEHTLLDHAISRGLNVDVIGKIGDLVGHRGYTKSFHSVNNQECIEILLKTMKSNEAHLIIGNFVQFDMDWGHRNDIQGFKKGLEEIDPGINMVYNDLADADLLMITADHGNDPTTPSTDHSREYVPILACMKNRKGTDLGVRSGFSDVARTAARYLDIEGVENGKDFLDLLIAG